MALIDTHAHLDDARFGADRDAVIERARANGLVRIIAVATSAASSHSCLAMARANDFLRPTVGIHPNHVAQEPPGSWDDVTRFADDPLVVGLGETGLDRHWHDTPFDRQEEMFARHLDLSRRTGLPVVIHCREADEDVRRMLRAEFDARGPIRAVMHSFCGDASLAADCLAMGLFISYSGMLTYKNADSIRETARVVPLDRILVETDCPYLAPVPVRGQRNEPAHVTHIASRLADVMGVSLQTIHERTTENAHRLFQRENPT